MNEKHTIVVCEYGWILFGVITGRSDEYLSLANAHVVRRWTNGKGIGGLAQEDNKDEYRLDEVGDVNISNSKILFTIPCEW